MSTNDVAAAAEKVKGSVKEAIGKLTGNARAEREGVAEKSLEPGDAPARASGAPETRDITKPS